jgi:hypothetical protein
VVQNAKRIIRDDGEADSDADDGDGLNASWQLLK